jgi:hypothetical protein
LSEREDSELEGLNDAYRSALEQTIERVVGELPRDADGRLEPDPAALARLRREFGRFGDAQGASLLLEQHVERVSAALTRQVDVLSDGWQRLGEDPLESDQLALSTLVKANFLDGFTELGRYHHNALRDAVMRQALGRATERDLRAELQRITGKAASEVDRQHHDAVIGYSRAVISESAEQRGYEHFQYIGPDDSANRPFCDRHVDKVYTREEIDALDNGQIANVFLTGGGYRCRHHWRPVRPEWFSADEIEIEPRDAGELRGGGTGTDPRDIYSNVLETSDMPRQEKGYSCGAAVARGILRDVGVDVPEAPIYALASQGSWDDDGNPVSLMNASDIKRGIVQFGPFEPGQVMAGGLPFVPDEHFVRWANSRDHLTTLQGGHWVIVDEIVGDVVKLRDPWHWDGPVRVEEPDRVDGIRGEVDLESFLRSFNSTGRNVVAVKL